MVCVGWWSVLSVTSELDEKLLGIEWAEQTGY